MERRKGNEVASLAVDLVTQGLRNSPIPHEGMQAFSLGLIATGSSVFRQHRYTELHTVMKIYTGVDLHDHTESIVRGVIDHGVTPVFLQDPREPIERDILDAAFVDVSGFLVLGTFFSRLGEDESLQGETDDRIIRMARCREMLLAQSALRNSIKVPRSGISSMRGEENFWWIKRMER